MVEILETLKKYFVTYWVFIKNALITIMEYRANFFINLVVECVNLFLKIVYVIVIFKAGITIETISKDEIMLYVGIYIIISGIIFSFFLNNFNRLSDYVRNGDLDVLIMKPISLQFLVTMRYINFSNLVPNIVGGSFMVITSLKKLQIELSPGTIIISAILILSSLLISYAILFIPAILSLWVVRTWGFYDSVVSSLMEFNNLPMQIYSKHIIRIGIFIVPVLVISNFPVLQLLERMEPIYLVWAFIAPIILLFISRYFWQYAIKHYVSASS